MRFPRRRWLVFIAHWLMPCITGRRRALGVVVRFEELWP